MSLVFNNFQFILGLSLGLVCSIVMSIWKSNQSQSLCEETVEKISKKIKKNTEMKMVIVVRKDLKLTKRELMVQCVHACIGAFKESLIRNQSIVKHWQRWGQAKVAVKVNNEAELLSIQKEAYKENLVNYLVRDTDPSKNNALILVIGPDIVEDINVVTGHLKLY